MKHLRLPSIFKTASRVILVIIAVGVLAVAAYLQHPLFGKNPDGARLMRISASPHHQGGAFQNQLQTPMLTTEESQFSLMLSNTFGKQQGITRPPGIIPAIKTDLKALDITQDLVIWLGHSSYYVQLGGQRMLIDPVFSDHAAPVSWAVRAFDGTNLYHADDMPEIDVLLITHDHYDHLDYQTIKALQRKVKRVVAGLGVGSHFESWGYNAARIQEGDWYDRIIHSPTLDIIITPARHFSGRTLIRDKTLWAGFALISSRRRLFFSGDSGYSAHFSEIGERYGPFDWVALDSGQYDPRWALVHMNPEQAAQAAEDLRANALTPGHVGKFSISAHDWDDPFKRITAASRNRHYQLWTPKIGQPIYLDGREQNFSAWWETVPHPRIH